MWRLPLPLLLLLLACSGPRTSSSSASPADAPGRGPGRAVGAAPPPWDAEGRAIYHRASRELVQKMNRPRGIRDLRIHPLPYVLRAVESDIWKVLSSVPPRFEPATYSTFLQYINPDTTYIDFGTWVGPTLLFAAQIARRSFGIEADPAAFAEVRMNVLLNSHHLWPRRTKVSPGCVATAADVGYLPMSTNAAGGSCSSLNTGTNPCGTITQRWNVSCLSLPQWFQRWGVTLDSNVFIKIDVESYECKLLPDLATWFLGAPSKPTVFFAMHAQVQPCTADQYRAIRALAAAYRHVYCVKDNVPWPGAADTDIPCKADETLMTDW